MPHLLSSQHEARPFGHLTSCLREGGHSRPITEAGPTGVGLSGTGVFIDINVPDSYPGREERMWPRDAHASLQTSGSVTSLPIWQLGILCEFYTLRGREEIYSFLQARHHLVPLLVDAYFQIAKYFGPDPDIILEVFTDPEGDRHKELFAFIQTPLPPQDAIAGLRQLDHGWWLEAVAAAEGNLSISLEFK